VNSYHRLVPGFEAPVNLVYSQRNRSACIRIPITGSNPKAKRDRVPLPRPVGEPVPGLLGQLLAGLDGIRNKIEPADPDRQGPVRTAARRSTRRSTRSRPRLPAVIDSLEADHEFLLEGDVFTGDLIETWIDFKREQEIAPIQLRPHPHEFELYYDV
jgi:glutamine synthetase